MTHSYYKYVVALISVLVVFLMAGIVWAQTGKPIVVIDPAHGGKDQGVLGIHQTAEKDLTLAIALAMQRELAQDSRIQVVLTRNDDRTVSVEDRQEKIQKLHPAMVLSLHVNAGFGRNSSGFEMYYPGFKALETSRTGENGQTGTSQNQYLGDAVKLARLTQKNLDVLFPRKGRGLREAMTPLSEGLSVPVLVVELAFVTNAEEKKKLTDGKIQADIARALAKSVQAFF